MFADWLEAAPFGGTASWVELGWLGSCIAVAVIAALNLRDARLASRDLTEQGVNGQLAVVAQGNLIRNRARLSMQVFFFLFGIAFAAVSTVAAPDWVRIVTPLAAAGAQASIAWTVIVDYRCHYILLDLIAKEAT